MRPLALFVSMALAVCLATGGVAEGAQIDVDFHRAPVAEALRLLADAQGVNLVVDEAVTGEVSMTVQDVSAKAAMDLIVAMHGLLVHQVGNTLVVSSSPWPQALLSEKSEGSLTFTQRPVSEIVQKLAERAGWNLIIEQPLDREITAWIDGLPFVDALRIVGEAAGIQYQLVDGVLRVKGVEEPPAPETLVAIHRLDHVDPERAGELLSVYVPEAIVEVDAPTRSVVVKGTAGQIQEVAAFLQEFDVGKPQVLVEARILEIAVDALLDLGVDWGRLPTLMGTGTPMAASLTWNPAQLQATLHALTERGRSKVLASPKISAVDGEPARMLIGDRVPIVTANTDSEGRVTESVSYLDVGIVLEIEPRIASDGTVTLDIVTEVSSVADTTARFPTVRTREARSQVRVLDGRPLIIGGLIQEEERERMSGIPLLSDLPVLGSLFSRQIVEDVQTEMIIILTPYIVNDFERVPGEADQAETSRVEADQAEPSQGAAPATGGPAAESAEALAERPTTAVTFDVVSLASGATELHVEHAEGNAGLFSRFYASYQPAGYGWSVGGGLRLYGGENRSAPSWRPWVEGAAEYLSAPNNEAGLALSTGAGLQFRPSERALVEVYARIQGPSDLLDASNLPSRLSRSLGIKLGWVH